MKSKKNKILAATACGVIVTSIGASFLFNKPNEDKAEDIKKDIEEIENNETEELAEEIENTEDLFLNNTEGLKALIGDEQIVLPEGTNIKIIFPKEIANQNIITNMARTLDFDFNISYGKLEKFREDVLGSLIITVKDHYANAVKRYLDEKNIKWEEIKNDN